MDYILSILLMAGALFAFLALLAIGWGISIAMKARTRGEDGRRKIVKTRDEAWDAQEQYEGQPHGWIQWKGTNVCMDVHCECGEHHHIDADFAYNLKCMSCGRTYFVSGHVELIEMTETDESTGIVIEMRPEQEGGDS